MSHSLVIARDLIICVVSKGRKQGVDGEGAVVIGREMFESLSAATRRHLHEDLFPSQL